MDVEKVAEAISSDPDVVLATHTMFTCSDTSLSEIKKQIEEHRLNRIVVASCTPRTHEPLFRETLREAGLNPYLFEMANIRDQCSWVHSAAPDAATQKAIELVKMSIARAQAPEPLFGESLAVVQNGLVIGGGLSGMTAALALADQGFKVALIEKSGALGGQMLNVHSVLEDDDPYFFTANLLYRTQNHRNIKVYLESEVTKVNGHIGKFAVTVSERGKGNGQGEITKTDISCGAIIVATGAEPAKTGEFLYGESENVLTQVELEKRLHEDRFAGGAKNIVMIQCAGSRNDERPYCSRICCSMAVKNALAIKKQNPDANVYVLYRDIRTYGFREMYYQTGPRGRGRLPPVQRGKAAGGLPGERACSSRVNSPDFPEPIEIEADHVVLSTGIAAPAGQQAALGHAQGAAQRRRVLRGGAHEAAPGGFRHRRHLPLRPGPFAEVHRREHLPGARRRGTGGDGAVQDAPGRQRPGLVREPGQVHLLHDLRARLPVRRALCNKDGKGQIEAAKCMGCGICASECPACAIQLNHFESDQFKAMLG